MKLKGHKWYFGLGRSPSYRGLVSSLFAENLKVTTTINSAKNIFCIKTARIKCGYHVMSLLYIGRMDTLAQYSVKFPLLNTRAEDRTAINIIIWESTFPEKPFPSPVVR